MTDSQLFSDKVDSWLKMLETPWARLQYSISHANILKHTAGQRLHILDAGGGSGADAVPFAQGGHRVEIIDYSAEMLTAAQQHAANNAVSERVKTTHADVWQIPYLFPNQPFDAVFSHNVIQYVEDADAMIRAVTQPLKSGGLLSLGTLNPASDVLRLALRENDFEAAFKQLESDTARTTLYGAPVRLNSAETLITLLNKNGFELIEHYGVRCINDWVINNEIKFSEAGFAKLARLEHAVTNRDPYRQIARFTQLIARKK